MSIHKYPYIYFNFVNFFLLIVFICKENRYHIKQEIKAAGGWCVLSSVWRRHLLGQNGLDKLNVVNVTISCNVDTLEQLIHLRVTKLLTQRRQNVAQFTNTNKSSLVLIKDLESTDVVLGLTKRFKSIRTVDNLGKGIKIEITAKGAFQFINLAQSGVLAHGAKEIAKGLRGDTTSTTLVEKRESVLVCLGVLCLQGGKKKKKSVLVVVDHIQMYYNYNDPEAIASRRKNVPL